ncbi:copper resistance protein CopC [Streptomyces sp. LP11]|uniref:Copper resistance protein CopC n=1 Tax=Streptomyces pyxinicus TaxID=2970331 RepID=A0ABT2AZM3_9ACTN|nr:copper resistance protein CopC [Streptomyces sp. LP11]MCS0601595.1 copper resistance protein CopC [Streptomyces sp. LP11]
MLLCTTLLLASLAATGTASAHAALRATDPADGTVLRTAPRHLTLTFTESVGLLTDSFRIYDPENHLLRTGPAGHAPGRSDTARVGLPARTAEGTYTVAWRVVSADSHPVSGALTFSVGKRTATKPIPAPDRAEHPATTALYNIARYLAYLSVAVLLGTAAYVTYCRPEATTPLRTPALTATATLALSTTALLLLRAPYEEGTSPTTALSLTALTHTATTRPGALLLARLALLLLAALTAPTLLRRRTLPATAALHALTLSLSLFLSLTWTGAEHASAGIQVPLAIASATLHLLAMAAWLGGLTALLRTLPHVTPDTLTRFSRLAFTSVTVLVVTGVYQSWRGLGSWHALTDTTYGRTLLAKLAAVAALLLAAACSRTWTTRLTRTPSHHFGDATAVRPLRRSVLAEAAVGVVVLVLTTLLTTTVPGRAATETATPAAGIPTASVLTVPFDVGTPGGHGKIQLTLDPGRVGRNSLQAVVYGPDGGLATVPELRVTLTLPAQRLGPLDTKLTNRGGYWATDTLDLPIPGTWTLKTTVRVSEVDQVTVAGRVRVTG